MSADLTYKPLCGCRVTFFFSAGFRTSEMTACELHNGPRDIEVRNRISDRARQWRDRQLGWVDGSAGVPGAEPRPSQTGGVQ